MKEFFFIAQILSAGRDGFLKVHPVVELSEGFFNLKNIVYLEFWGKKKKFVVEDILKIKNSVFLKFYNFDDEREVSVLIGRKIFVTKDVFSSLSDNNSVLSDFVDCSVYRSEEYLGLVTDAFSTPANNVIEILKGDGSKILIPVIDVYFEMMDVKNKKIILKPDAGFFEDED